MKKSLYTDIFIAVSGLHMLFAQTNKHEHFHPYKEISLSERLVAAKDDCVQTDMSSFALALVNAVCEKNINTPHFVVFKQDQPRPISSDSRSSTDNYSRSPLQKMGFDEGKANDVNMKAVRDFLKVFKNVTNNKWTIADDGSTTSTFLVRGIKTTVSYDKEGGRQYIMEEYGENNLAFEIRDLVKKEYDGTITLVKGYETNKGCVIYVHIEDKQGWSIVQIANGDMKLIERLTKSR